MSSADYASTAAQLVVSAVTAASPCLAASHALTVSLELVLTDHAETPTGQTTVSGT